MMKILSCKVHNFASYKQLEFDFSGQGLTLLSGPTGSGKSTLCDIVPWILFGRTSKGGSVDEVRSWHSDDPTEGTAYLPTMTVHRTRGKTNDLWYCLAGGDIKETRGKDLLDTQRLINANLGFDFELYLSGAYFHEFSQTSQFFTTTAKNRRQITEQLVDLNLATKLVSNVSDYKKEVKKEIEAHNSKILLLENSLDLTDKTLVAETHKALEWKKLIAYKLVKLTESKDNYKNQLLKQLEETVIKYEEQKSLLELTVADLNESIVSDSNINEMRNNVQHLRSHNKESVCPTCGNVKNREQDLIITKKEYDLNRLESDNIQNINRLKTAKQQLAKYLSTPAKTINLDSENPYVQQIKELQTSENPHENTVCTLTTQLNQYKSDLLSTEASLKDFSQEHADLELLLEVTDSFRSILIKNTVVDLETNTNKILHDYFDAEIQVKFELNEADKLEVDIWKNGNQATFTQLSKGQRQLLKMSFGISVMKAVSNHHGISFNAIFCDEMLDGLDDQLKVKTYDLLQSLSLEHDSVFVVEHNESLKAMFPKRFDVTLTAEGSQIAEA